MPNSFLGFPVPRAKIADMIAAAAPPSLHHAQHENGGSDEIDVTGLVGAGGGFQVPFSNHVFHSDCSSIAALIVNATGSGVCAADDNGIVLETFNTAGTEVEAKSELASTVPFQSWDNARQFDCTVKMRSSTNKTADMYFITGSRADNMGFGFYVSEGELYAFTGNGATTTYLSVEVLATGSYTKYRQLRAVFTPTVNVKFYVDSVLVATLTTTLPSGTSFSNTYADFYVSNNAEANDKYALINSYTVLIND